MDWLRRWFGTSDAAHDPDPDPAWHGPAEFRIGIRRIESGLQMVVIRGHGR